ncbi:MAG TPA: hypothetical protein H9835_04825 [Candidatus Agathobaculum merdigallinarum]|nr:hypothetical protein [Candidatus Agathobaculum merdigallinarum]
MLMCTETVTLIRAVRGKDGETYTCTPLAGASWYGKAVTVPSADGARIQNTYKARIPAENMPDGVTPCTGDYLVRGTVAQVTRAPADFAGMEYFLISAVGDNRRGRLQHWAVSGA